MTLNNKIDPDHESWKPYYEAKDMLHATHSLVEVNGPFDIYNMAMQIPPEEITPIIKLMKKESFDCANRFSLTGGIIQGEFEIWDGNYKKHLYFCVDFTLKQAIKFSEQVNPVIGFVPVEMPQMMIGMQQIFNIENIKKFIKIKTMFDSRKKNHLGK